MLPIANIGRTGSCRTSGGTKLCWHVKTMAVICQTASPRLSETMAPDSRCLSDAWGLQLRRAHSAAKPER